jgi:hypothetical protein
MPTGNLARAALALGALVATDVMLPSVTLLEAAPAQAIVGAPLSPVSVAGVARRSTRRMVVATAAVATPPPPPTTVVVQSPPPAAAPPPPQPK